jgi:L-aspartate oxidase
LSQFEPGADSLDVPDLRNSLQSVLWRHAGIVRTRARLEEAQGDVGAWCRYVLAHEFAAPDGWELQNLLTIARLLVWSALEREESRGVHSRNDFPEPNIHWQRHLAVPAACQAAAVLR